MRDGSSTKEMHKQKMHVQIDLLQIYLSGVDELVGKALGDGLDVAEGSLAGTGGKQPDGLV